MKRLNHIAAFSLLLLLLIPARVSSQEISGRSGAYNFNIGQKRFVPPMLSIDNNSSRFTDENQNNILDPYEQAGFTFNIQNSGSGEAMGLKMKIAEKNNLPGLEYNKDIEIGNIPASSAKSVTIPITGNFNLKESNAVFSIIFSEKNGFEPQPFEITLKTAPFEPPAIKIVDSEGPRENKVSKGTPFKVVVLLGNLGKGKAAGINITLRSPEYTYLLAGKNFTQVRDLAPGDTAKITYSLVASSMYQNPVLKLDFLVKEKYNAFGDAQVYDFSVAQNINYDNLAIKPSEQAAVQRSDQQISIPLLGVDVDKNIPSGTKKNADNTYVLAFGNEDYKSYQPDLKSESNVDYAVNDAYVFTEYCKKVLGVPEKNITLKEDAQQYIMIREIDRFVKFSEIGKDIELIFYYSGHGFPDENKESYIMPVNIAGTDVKNGISLSNLYRKFTSFQCKRVTVFIDACFSGGGRNAGLVASRAVKIFPKEITVDGNIVVFTASSGDEESSYYKGKNHGIFTYYLLKKLQETKGDLAYGELYDYLKENVQRTALEIYKDQHPQVLVGAEIEQKWSAWTFK
jgi:hypothetical protein